MATIRTAFRTIPAGTLAMLTSSIVVFIASRSWRDGLQGINAKSEALAAASVTDSELGDVSITRRSVSSSAASITAVNR